MTFSCLSALVLTFVLAVPTGAASADPFAAILADRFDGLNVPGLGYAVIEGGRIAETGGLGMADVIGERAAGGDTPFRVASLTKPIAAALTLGAVRDGALDLKTPLRDASPAYRDHCPQMRAYFAENDLPFLDGVPCDSAEITLRHVLTHTATAPPGGAFRYNGFLFGLLGDVVADALRPEEGFAAVVRARVIDPLELADSAAGIEDAAASDVIARLAPPHRREGAGWTVLPPLEDALNAGAGLIASAGDMARIDQAMNDALTDPWSRARMTTPEWLRDGTVSPYGMGWFVQEVEGHRVLWHHGHQPGAYSSLWIRDVTLGRSLILLANADGLAAGRDLARGDLRRSEIAMAFLTWSASRERVKHN